MTGKFTDHNDGYQHRMHNKNLLFVHLVFVTKYRKCILTEKFSEILKETVRQICADNKWYIKRMETDMDHIHILLQYNPIDNISAIVGKLKQLSTYRMWQAFPSVLKKYYWKEKTLWSDGYFACSIGNASKAVIEQYIENQG